MLKNAVLLSGILMFIGSCTSPGLKWDFDRENDRVWLGPDFWAVPLEQWRLNDGRIECTGNNPNARVNVLTRMLDGNGSLALSVRMGLIEKGPVKGSGGVRIGIRDDTDMHYTSLCYYGKGIDAGVDLTGSLFLGESSDLLPEGFDLGEFELKLTASPSEEGFDVILEVEDLNNQSGTVKLEGVSDLSGMVAMVNRAGTREKNSAGARFWFDDLMMTGSMVKEVPENAFGPILFSMYTVSKGTLNMSVQMPPLGMEDNHTLELQVDGPEGFRPVATTGVRPDSRIGVFRVKEWDVSRDQPYRIVYVESDKKGKETIHTREGMIRRDPVDRPLRMAGMTCQHWQGYPYSPLTRNVAKMDPDILYFSGDQIYEANGGYGIIRDDANQAILNYLGKWFMFGWAFGDLMRDRPTICIPDDHEVYQGNLWGEGGEVVSREKWADNPSCISGFVQPLEMIDVVMQTNCAHLPVPADPEPMKNGIPVYFTDLVYGNISFAIAGDRVFKSGPENVSWWEGRKDHIKIELEDPGVLEKEGLKLLGDRQLEFLESWVQDWSGAKMKCLLSQTIFANAATHHGGNREYLVGDMDSGGWPKSGRDRAISVIRKGFVYHISGDQHISSLIHYGIDAPEDAGWSFCTPAISVGYQRRFHPDRMGRPVQNRPEHGLPNTGGYQDVFGNHFHMYAIGNPDDNVDDPNRYQVAQKRASGFGMITFDPDRRTITADAIRFLGNVGRMSEADRFPGWPLTVNQADNYGRKTVCWLPKLVVRGDPDPVLHVIDASSNDLVYSLRIKGNEYQPGVFSPGTYNLKIGYPEKELWQSLEQLVAGFDIKMEPVVIQF